MKNTKVFLLMSSLFFSIFLAGSLFLVLPQKASADSLWNKQVGMGTEDDQVGHAFGETVDDRNDVTDVKIVLAKLINIFLGFLGIIFLILIIYGGFLWMTASGNEENVKKARSLLVAGVIGLIIVLSSYAIAKLITEKVFKATVTLAITVQV